MKKKVLALLMVMVMALALLAGCGGGGNSGGNSGGNAGANAGANATPGIPAATLRQAATTRLRSLSRATSLLTGRLP